MIKRRAVPPAKRRLIMLRREFGVTGGIDQDHVARGARCGKADLRGLSMVMP